MTSHESGAASMPETGPRTEAPSGADAVSVEGQHPNRPRRGWRGIVALVVTFAAALFLFVLAIQMMKKGAASFAPHLELVRWNALATLGIGAILAYVWLSGKPVAAFALALFAAGGLTRLQAFTMLSGGRLGAAFIVLLVGFLYFVRGHTTNRRESIGVGVLALLLTAVVYVPGMLVGYAILKTGALDGVRLTSTHLQGAVDVVWKPIVDWMAGGLPDALLLPLGGAVIVVAIKLLDRALPEFDPSRRARGDGARWRTPWPLFALGFAVTLVTFSVSVALTVLVPMAAKGHITRQEAIPYIMGANVATLADTLLVAFLYNNAVGVQIVLAEAIGVALVTLVCLALLYRPLSRGALAIDDWVVSTNRRLALFAVSLFLFPALLVGAGFAIGPLT
jgi:solute carrier family 34 (sodium-dependent phosphate cotransporter)